MDKILIIEDDELIAELERDYLFAEGLEADIASDGVEGLQQFESAEYAAVLLDIMLPEKGGFEVCREIRKKSDIPIFRYNLTPFSLFKFHISIFLLVHKFINFSI